MIHEELELCGKKVVLGYCYGTEFNYSEKTGEHASDYIKETCNTIVAEHPYIPDTEKGLKLIMSSIEAFYESRSEKAPLEYMELVSEVKPEELGMAIGTIIKMYVEFYRLPIANGTIKEEQGEKGKN